MPEEYSKFMVLMETAIKHGAENRTNDVVLAVTGKKPKTFREHITQEKAAWM